MWPYAVVTGTNHEGTMIHKSFTFHVIEYESLYRGHALSRSIVLCTLTRAGRGRSVGAMYWLTAPAARVGGNPAAHGRAGYLTGIEPPSPRHRTRKPQYCRFTQVVVPYMRDTTGRSAPVFSMTQRRRLRVPIPARQTALFLSSITTLVFGRRARLFNVQPYARRRRMQ